MPSQFYRTTTPTVSGGGGGGGSSTFNQFVMFAEKQGPASYPSGGFVIDLSATYSSLTSLRLVIKKGTRGSVPFGRFDVDLDSPSPGKATVLIRGFTQTRVSSFDTVTGQPAGVTVQTVAGQTVTADSSHTHEATHDHAAQLSAAMTAAGAGVALDALAPALDTHTHSVDLPSLAVTSGAGTSHNHTDSSLYAHIHALTHTVTNVGEAQLTAGTDLSGTTFYLAATGVRS